MTHRPPKLADIARAASTSVTTVSRVLAGGDGAQRISAATRQRVIDAAQAIGYRPNLLARSLRTRRTQTLALLASDIANPWFGQIALLIEQALQRQGQWLMLCNSHEDAETEAQYLRLLPRKGIDGLFLIPVIRSRKALLELVGRDLPTVVIDRPIAGIDSFVATDEDQLATLLCDTLARGGVRRVALVCGPSSQPTHRRRAELVSSRFQVVARHEGPAQPHTGREAFIHLLDLRYDAIVCTNNFLGQGVLNAIAEIEAPPIIGCVDEIPMMHLLPIPIVCCLQDVNGLAAGAVSLMEGLLRGEAPPPHILLPARAETNVAFQRRCGH